MKFKLAVLPGDGIGPEVLAEGVKVLEAVGKHGRARLLRYAALIQDYTEAFLRRTIRAIPDGDYAFVDFMDDDGLSREPVRIAVRVGIRGGRRGCARSQQRLEPVVAVGQPQLWLLAPGGEGV